MANGSETELNPLPLATCDVCRKQSDGAKSVTVKAFLCGTHYDAWLRSAELREPTPIADAYAAFLERMRKAYVGCWDKDGVTVWLTRDECIEKHKFDPTGYPDEAIKSKLARSSTTGAYQRVWASEAIVAYALHLHVMATGVEK